MGPTWKIFVAMSHQKLPVAATCRGKKPCAERPRGGEQWIVARTVTLFVNRDSKRWLGEQFRLEETGFDA
jgi:hypothetical protein